MQEARRLTLDSVWIYVQAAVVGIFGGLLGVVFRLGVDALEQLVLGAPEPTEASLSWWMALAIPTGGAILAALTLRTIRDRRGPFGIGDIVVLTHTRRGLIHPLDSLVQILSSGFSIASGGSIGREGANSQFGATVASLLGHRIPNSPRSRTVLLGCGIAAGMASAYKAPIAAAIFVMEVVLGNFAMDVLAPIVVASVISTLITAAVFGQDPLYAIGGTLVMTDWPLVLSTIVLGAMCGFGGILFRKSLDLGRAVFARVPAPTWVRMGLGGLIVGVIGIWYPEVWGNGQATIEVIADPQKNPGAALLVSLLFFKVVATAVTSGSGALGGVFTPNLVVGAAFGAAFAYAVDWLAPGGDHRTEFALVGMAGLIAATAHAPITAIILVFEMTGDYGLILPLMLCSVVGSITARLLDRDSIYTARLRAAGHADVTGIEELAIHANTVGDVMRHGAVAVRETAGFDEVLSRFQDGRHDLVYVVDARASLLGVIALHDVKQFINDLPPGTVVIAADLTRTSQVTRADETLAKILPRFDDPDLDELPVVADDGRLVGRITRRDLVACLSEEVLGHRGPRARLRTEDRAAPRAVELPPETGLARVPVPEALVDRSLESLDMPGEFGLWVLVVIERNDLGEEQRRLPAAQTVLHDRSEIIVMGENRAITGFRERFAIAEPAPG